MNCESRAKHFDHDGEQIYFFSMFVRVIHFIAAISFSLLVITGQKMYFWFAILGGGIMAYTGYIIWGFGAHLDTVRIFAMIHNVLGVGIVAFYLMHVYMSVFAIAGSLESMKTGYKPKDEVDILHSLYKYR